MKYKDKAGQVYDDLTAAVRTWCHVQHEPCEKCPIGVLKGKAFCQDWVNTCPTIVAQICGLEPLDDGGAKDDKDKPHPSYVAPEAIKAIMMTREYGTHKYKDGGPENWRTVKNPINRYHQALLRHALELWNDPYAIDPESGLPHLYHLMCNGNFLCALEANHEEQPTSPN